MNSEEFDNLMQGHAASHNGPSSTIDMKLDLLANQLKVNVVDSETSSSVTSPVEIVEEDPPSVSRTSPVKILSPPRLAPPVQNNDKMRKVELLRTFHELEQKGVRISTNYNIHSSLDEMEEEYAILRSMEIKKQAVRLYKGFMINGIQAIEFLNETYNPFDFHLKGWSEHITLSIDSYDDVLGEIYEKWKHTGRKVEPEIKLVIMILMSATTFHTSNSLLKGIFNTKSVPAAPSSSGPPPPPVVKAPNPREFLDRLRQEQVRSVHVSEESSASSTEMTSTTTTVRKKKPMTIKI